MSATGDAIGQLVSSSQTAKAFSFGRMGAFGLVGACWFGPWLHTWYGLLSKVEGRLRRWKLPPTVLYVLLVALNQSVAAVVGNVCFFYVFEFFKSIFGLSGPLSQVPAVATHTMQTKLLSSLKVNWTVFIVPSFVNLIFIPLPFRVLFMNLVAVVYNVLLSICCSDR